MCNINNNEHIKRIAWAIKAIKSDEALDKGINDSDLSLILKVDKNTLVRYRKGLQNTVKSVVVGVLINHYNFSPLWIFEGEGEPFPGAREKYPEVCGPMTEEEMRAIPRRRRGDDLMEFVQVPFIRSKAESDASWSEEDRDLFVKPMFRRGWLIRLGKPEDFVVLRKTGDCMEPTLRSNDHLLVYRGDNKVSVRGGIYVLEDSKDYAVRRIQPEYGSNRMLKLMCDNKKYETVITDVEFVTIYGRVVWIGRQTEIF